MFKKKIEIDSLSGCWNFTGYINWNGYGRFWFNEKLGYAHRFSYIHHKGIIPEGFELDHLCRNRKRSNPDHLEAVTKSENIKRGNAGEIIAAPLREKTHCPQGHPYSGDNLTIRDGRRHCKACARARYHARKQTQSVQVSANG